LRHQPCELLKVDSGVTVVAIEHLIEVSAIDENGRYAHRAPTIKKPRRVRPGFKKMLNPAYPQELGGS